MLEYPDSYLRIGAVALLLAGLYLVVGAVRLRFATIKYLYYGGTLGVAAVCLSSAAWRWWRSGEWGEFETVATGVGLVAAGTYVYATHVEPEMVRVRRHTLPVENVEERVRIVHLSDIQTIDVGQRERRIFERIRRIDPDLVVHTGDVLAHPTRRELREVADMFATLDPPGGVLNVDGDADRALTDAEWEWFDRRAGTETLLDRRRTVRVGGTRIDVLGLSGLGSRTVERPAVDEWLESVDPADRHVHLVIGHAPDYMLELRGADIDLALAGHTHGGQIRIPFYGPPVTLSEVPRSWARGVTRVDGTYLNVSAGIGAERAQGLPPIRINCPPEFSVIDLVPAEGG